MSNLVLSRLVGTLQSTFKIGAYKIVSSSQLEIQNSAGSPAPLKASAISLTTGAVDGYILTTDGSGNASWQVNAGGGGGGGSDAIPASANIFASYNFR